MDHAHIKKSEWFIIVDKFARLFLRGRPQRATTEEVWKTFETLFNFFGFPSEIRTVNSPQFREKFTELCRKNRTST